MVQVALVVLTSADLLVDLDADFGMPLSLFLDQSEHVELFEVLRPLQLIDDLGAFLVGVWVATGSDQKDCWLDSRAELVEG